MKLHKIFFSPTGGTKRVLDIISDAWECEVYNVDLTDALMDFSKVKINTEDMCIVAVPSYGGRVATTAISRLKEIKGEHSKAILVSVYGNRASEDTLIELKDVLKESGFNCIAGIEAVAEHSIMHQFASYRPDSEDKKQLMEFSNKIIDIIEKENNLLEVKVPGNINYKEYKGVPLKPIVGKACNKCGICAKKCPTQAISTDNPKDLDKDKCISCMRCISICPQDGRHLNKVLYFVASQKMNKVCKDRKENKLYI